MTSPLDRGFGQRCLDVVAQPFNDVVDHPPVVDSAPCAWSVHVTSILSCDCRHHIGKLTGFEWN